MNSEDNWDLFLSADKSLSPLLSCCIWVFFRNCNVLSFIFCLDDISFVSLSSFDEGFLQVIVLDILCVVLSWNGYIYTVFGMLFSLYFFCLVFLMAVRFSPSNWFKAYCTRQSYTWFSSPIGWVMFFCNCTRLSAIRSTGINVCGPPFDLGMTVWIL
jgi:hypothetical protein